MDFYAVRRRSLHFSEQVGEASYPGWASVQHMGINHCSAHILMPQDLLDRADVLEPCQQMSGKGVAEDMAVCCLGHSSFSNGRYSIFGTPL